MATKKPDNLLAIGDDIHICVPQAKDEDAAGLRERDPTVILMFGWMGALLPHLNKYVEAYRKLYPQATCILVQSRPSFFLFSDRINAARLTPVVEVLEALGCIPPLNGAPPPMKPISAKGVTAVSNPRILVHAFSNGGSYNMITLGQMLSTTSPLSNGSNAARTRIPNAIILDSTPGSGGLRSTIKAFTGVVRNPILRYVVAFFVSGMHFFHHLCALLIPWQLTPIETLNRALLNPHLFPWTNAQTPRLYVYSKQDALIPWKQIQGHAGQAETAGLPVTTCLYEDSAHVAHARQDPARYWAAVQALWETVAGPST
ncbi:hypothetical protein PLICRDRAFT_39840 [Plicaturopsis crispa FD-325 SS-3]|nr:hypothetical protein PLICRDRAFT_39840 [Plicaturopsis crispa FD-325 SS-3]